MNPRCNQVRLDYNDAYQMHKTLMNAFPDGIRREDVRLLWRLEYNRNRNDISVLAQSMKKPEWGKIKDRHEAYFAEVHNNPAVKELQTDVFRNLEEKRLLFKLRANPSRRVNSVSKDERLRGKGKNKGKRIGIIDGKEQLLWLNRKLSSGGCKLISANAVRESISGTLIKGFKRDGGAVKKLSILSVVFEGVLEVYDADSFVDMANKGVGPAKGLGFGLLSFAGLSSKGENG